MSMRHARIATFRPPLLPPDTTSDRWGCPRCGFVRVALGLPRERAALVLRAAREGHVCTAVSGA